MANKQSFSAKPHAQELHSVQERLKSKEKDGNLPAISYRQLLEGLNKVPPGGKKKNRPALYEANQSKRAMTI